MSEQVILVVDDEIANLQKLRRTFINRYPVLAASNGREALDLVHKHANIAVIVADQRMPDMTGIEFLRQTLEILPDAVRIILTGFTDVDVLMEAINYCKVFRYMVKPWDPPDLLMTVERGLETHRLAAENARFRKELIRRERLARRKGERERAVQRAKDAVAEIHATGVQVKDLDIGLLDFPCEVDGEIVLLCWKLGEEKITHWHGTEEGFAGRKPIDERIARAGKKQE